MIFDPFALVPIHTQPEITVEPVKGYKGTLVPQVPPQEYQTTQNKTVEKPDTNLTLQYFLSQARTSNVPLYEYSFEEEKRYSNPYLQFNPKPLGGYDTEDIYANFQGSGEQLWNALVKTGATAASSFISSFSTFGSSIDAIRKGQPFDENSTLGQTQGWLRELENEYPNYYTQWERENPLSAALTPTGFANFWGDKVLKNVGFTVGSLASSFLVDAGINLATGGTGTPATFILAANQIKKAISPLKNMFRSLAKTSTLNKVDDLMGVARVGEGINKGLSSMNQAYNLKKGLQFTGTTYFAAQGEAMIEGYQTYWDTKAKLYEQNINNLTLDKVEQIETLAQDAANTTTLLNLPIIAASNLLQFPTIFGGKSLLKQFDSPFLDIVNKEGLTAVNNYSKKQAWVNTAKELTKDFITEGGEEGYQYYVGNSIHDYYVDKFNETATQSLSNYLAEQLPKTVQDEKFWESFVIGGLAGGLMNTYDTVKTNFSNERTQRAVETLQPVLDRFNSTVKDYVHFSETIEHEADEDLTNKFQTAHKALFSTVHDSLKYGVYDNFRDSVEDLKNLPVEEYNKLFGTESNERDKLTHLSNIQNESERIKSDLTEVNKFFQVNPFDSSYVNQRLRDVFKVDQTQIENIKKKLFEDYKELTAYNISRLRNTRKRISDIEEELKAEGLDNSIVPILYNLDTPEGVKEYSKFKEVQLSTLEDELNYYKELEQPSPELKLRINRVKKVINSLGKFDKEQLSDVEKEQVREILFMEEMGKKQLTQEDKLRQEELKKQQELAVKTAEDLEKQTTKPQEKVVEQVETISKIVPKEEKVVPDVNKPKQIDIFNRNFANLEVGDNFTVQLSTEGGTFTLLTKQPFVAEKDGIKYHFMPDRVVKHDNGEQVLRYSLDNIGVQKIDKEQPKQIDTQKIKEDYVRSIINQDGTVTLYRGVSPGGEKGTGQFWTSDKSVAEFYANRFGKGEVVEKTVSFEEAVKGFMGQEGNAGRAQGSDIFSLETVNDVKTPKQTKPKKETITKKEQLKQAIDKKKDKVVKPVKDGIYLIDGDYTNAWRYVDENTAVPLKLRLKGNQLEYYGDMTKGIDQSITEGYLLDDQYIQGVDTRVLLEEESPIFGQDVRPLIEQLTTEDISEKDKGLSLPELAERLRQKEQTQTNNLAKFLKDETISDVLRQVLEWRSGKGIRIDC